MTMAGTVYLIGAGPGDPGLITVKGINKLKQADVIVYDYLANPSLLEVTRPDAELIYVGKKAGAHSMKQQQINQLLIDKAKDGLTVARLKGGDPFVFGRGGEEAEALHNAGIEFAVVPGVTAAMAAGAYAGIPLTHRGVAATVGIATGHEDPTKETEHIDWNKAATGTETLAIYMGVKNLPSIIGKLQRGGRPDSTPVAVVSWATHPRQHCITGTLETIVPKTTEAGIQPPALVIVGEVVNLRSKLAWFEKLPLFGKKIVITRPKHQAAELAAKLQELGAEAIFFPTIKIVPPDDYAPLDNALNRLSDYAWVVFTSVNGVKSFFQRLMHLGKDARALAGCKLAAIGPATEKALQERYLHVECRPAQFIAEELAAELQKTADITDKRILLARAAEARDALPQTLQTAGATVDDVAAYQTLPETDVSPEVQTQIARADFDVITFTSSSTVRNFVSLMGLDRARENCGKTICASIGPITTQTAETAGIRIQIEAAEYTTDGLVAAVCNKFTVDRM